MPALSVFIADGPSFMITSSNLGHLGVWNLETRLPVAQKEYAHADAVTGLKCFPSEQIFATSSPDNSLRLWIMDDNVAGMRLLMFKEGHAEPPNRIRFYGMNKFFKNIIKILKIFDFII